MAQQSGDQRRSRLTEAYRNEAFLNSRAARSLRILSEYIEPQSRFEHFQIEDTIVFMGSARLLSREQAEQALPPAPCASALSLACGTRYVRRRTGPPNGGAG